MDTNYKHVVKMVPSTGSAEEAPVNSEGTESTDPLRVGHVIQTMRERAGLSRRQLSAAIGYSPSYCGKVEAGQTEPSLHAFAKIAHQLKLTAAEILLIMKHEAQRQT